MYFSNRSAAFSQLKDFESAIRDAKSAIRLKPEWVKGWARLACAHYGLEEYSEAKDAYMKAMDLQPEDETLQQGFFKVRAFKSTRLVIVQDGLFLMLIAATLNIHDCS